MSNTYNISDFIIRNTENIHSNELGDELVIMNIETGNFVTLNHMARVIWEQLEQPTTAEKLIQYLLSRFKVNEDKCTRETYAFLEKLKEQELLS